MKVKELIELLQKEKQDLDVCFWFAPDSSLCDIGNVRQENEEDYECFGNNEVVVIFPE